MNERLIVDLRCGRDGPAAAWRYYLPAGSKALDGFQVPVSITVKGGTRNPGKPPPNVVLRRGFRGDDRVAQGLRERPVVEGAFGCSQGFDTAIGPCIARRPRKGEEAAFVKELWGSDGRNRCQLLWPERVGRTYDLLSPCSIWW